MDRIASGLSPTEQVTVAQCLRAAVEGPFFPDGEFETLFGVTRERVKSARSEWLEHLSDSEEVGAAVVGSMNHLLGYPHGKFAEWDRFIAVPPETVNSTLRKLLSLGA